MEMWEQVGSATATLWGSGGGAPALCWAAGLCGPVHLRAGCTLSLPWSSDTPTSWEGRRS